jgi:hypothetical protein
MHARLTPLSPLQDRLWQDSGLPLPNHPLHPPSQSNLNKTRKDCFCAHPGPYKGAGIPSNLHHQNLHNFLRARSSRREPDEEGGHSSHSRETFGTAGYRYCYAQSCQPVDQ